MTITLDGSHLTIDDIVSVIRDSDTKVEISKEAYARCKKSKEYLDGNLEGKIVYGVNTGFGPMSSHIIDRNELDQLQGNLVRSHAVGIGEPIDDDFVLAAMIIRLNTLVKGYSAVSVELLDRLLCFINNRVIPIVPKHGAVGASGDLVQLAHVALAIIGEGEVRVRGERKKTSEVLSGLGLQPYTLKLKEGLSLINGTSVMAGIASINIKNALQVLSIAVRNGALSLELVQAFNDGISEELHNLRPHEGQKIVAKHLRAIAGESKLLRNRKILSRKNGSKEEVKELPESVQEVYSLRCIPQILGPVYDAIKSTKKVVEIEINSVTDNPIIDSERDHIYHGGNFHGDYVSIASDTLKISLVKLTMLSERRINFFVNRNINKHFPPFLNLERPGFALGLQGLQFVATSTTARSQTLAYPQYVHSIPTNADNQDIVSLGTDAALVTSEVIDSCYTVLVAELVTLAQAVDFLGCVNDISPESKKLFEEIRSLVPVIKKDRSLSPELEQLVASAQSSDMFQIKW